MPRSKAKITASSLVSMTKVEQLTSTLLSLLGDKCVICADQSAGPSQSLVLPYPHLCEELLQPTTSLHPVSKLEVRECGKDDTRWNNQPKNEEEGPLIQQFSSRQVLA